MWSICFVPVSVFYIYLCGLSRDTVGWDETHYQKNTLLFSWNITEFLLHSAARVMSYLFELLWVLVESWQQSSFFDQRNWLKSFLSTRVRKSLQLLHTHTNTYTKCHVILITAPPQQCLTQSAINYLLICSFMLTSSTKDCPTVDLKWP